MKAGSNYSDIMHPGYVIRGRRFRTKGVRLYTLCFGSIGPLLNDIDEHGSRGEYRNQR